MGGGWEVSEGQKIMCTALPRPTIFLRKKGGARFRGLCAYSDEYGTFRKRGVRELEVCLLIRMNMVLLEKKGGARIRGLCAYSDEYGTFRKKRGGTRIRGLCAYSDEYGTSTSICVK